MHYGKSAPLPSLRRPILCLMHADLLVRRETPPALPGDIYATPAIAELTASTSAPRSLPSVALPLYGLEGCR
jgi:hypothetical protein